MKIFYYIIIIFILFLLSCFNPCHNEIIEIILSPDNEFIAIAFIRDCGTASSYSPQVYILDNSNKNRNVNYNKITGNVFRGNVSKFINIYWKDAKTLIVEHSCTEELIIESLEYYQGIKIEYIVSLDKENYR